MIYFPPNNNTTIYADEPCQVQIQKIKKDLMTPLGLLNMVNFSGMGHSTGSAHVIYFGSLVPTIQYQTETYFVAFYIRKKMEPCELGVMFDSRGDEGK